MKQRVSIFKTALATCLLVMSLMPATAGADVILPDVNIDGQADIMDVTNDTIVFSEYRF